MLRRVSLQTRSITARPSTLTLRARRPISLAKVIFTAWNALQAYLSISATPIDVTMNSHFRCPKTSRSTLAARSSSVPITVNGGLS